MWKCMRFTSTGRRQMGQGTVLLVSSAGCSKKDSGVVLPLLCRFFFFFQPCEGL